MTERIWDSFLTQQDRAHLATTGHRRIGFGKKPALLLIDWYHWVFGDQPEPLLEAVETWPGSCGLAALGRHTSHPDLAANRQRNQSPHCTHDWPGSSRYGGVERLTGVAAAIGPESRSPGPPPASG
jgi:hypothetical protein